MKLWYEAKYSMFGLGFEPVELRLRQRQLFPYNGWVGVA